MGTIDANIQGMLNYYRHKIIPFGIIKVNGRPISGQEARKLLKKGLKQGCKFLSEIK
jgi:hypothetical protein